MSCLAPSLILRDGSLESRKLITITDGIIESIDSCPEEIESVANTLLAPAFVNAHSHVFQHAMRGMAEIYSTEESNFWSWRQSMYKLANSISEDDFFEIAVRAFTAMRKSGYASVGEFHYLRHLDKEDYLFDEIVIKAAEEAGIRIVLMPACYETGSIAQPLCQEQIRFNTKNYEFWKEGWDRLQDLTDKKQLCSLGVVAHSIRAVPTERLGQLAQIAISKCCPFHIHLEEQVKEIEDSKKEYGLTPMQWLMNNGFVKDSKPVAIHATHTSEEDIYNFGECGGQVCVCPTTEAWLGDGFCNARSIFNSGASVSIGADSNLRLDPFEEMRWFSFGQRLQHQSRGVLSDSKGEVASRLLEAAALGGAKALNLSTGRLEVGAPADLIEIDLSHPSLLGIDFEYILPGLVFSADVGAINATAVAGKWGTEKPCSLLN